jgi:hypothetical protein
MAIRNDQVSFAANGVKFFCMDHDFVLTLRKMVGPSDHIPGISKMPVSTSGNDMLAFYTGQPPHCRAGIETIRAITKSAPSGWIRAWWQTSGIVRSVRNTATRLDLNSQGIPRAETGASDTFNGRRWK